jgi:uncharacterized membrane protein
MVPTFTNLVAGCIIAHCNSEYGRAFTPSLSALLHQTTSHGDRHPAKIRLAHSVSSQQSITPSTTSFAPLFQTRTRSNSLWIKLLKEIPQSGFWRALSTITLRHTDRSRSTSAARAFIRWIRRSVVMIAVFLMVIFNMLPLAVAAGSSGRMGGSFGSSNSHGGSSVQSTISEHQFTSPRTSPMKYYSPSTWSSSAGSPYLALPLPHQYHRIRHRQSRPFRHKKTSRRTNTLVNNKSQGTNQLRYNVVLVTSTAVGVLYGISKRRVDDYSGPNSPLGPGFSVLSLTACLNVLDRNDPSSILQRLSELAQSSDTSNRKGLQYLMTETSLELARQEKVVLSVETQYKHLKTSTEAERQYNQLSERYRSKFERESLSNYGGKLSRVEPGVKSVVSIHSTATVAIVIILLSLEGNSLRHFDGIKSRKDLKEALSLIYSDVQVGDCLMAGEVIWSPQDPSEQMTIQEIYSDFPTLNTLLD